jgi:uncharacterized membrane protein
MTYYEILKFLHVLAAIIWLGGGFMILTLVVRAERADDGLLLKKIAENTKWLAQRIFIPSSLAVLVLGILATIEGPWGFGDLWIVLGLIGYAASFLTGILFLEPEGKRIDAAMTEYGPGSPQAAHHIRRINVVQRMEMVILFLVVAVMAVKPTGDDTGALLLGAAIVLATLAVGARGLSARPSSADAAAQTD